MRKKSEITQKDFDGLLGWLSPDIREAGKKYEQIRVGLIRFFQHRGCPDAEGLADEAFNRVAAKLSTFQADKNFKFADYFYSFANKIYLEDLKKRKRRIAGYDKLENLRTDGVAGRDADPVVSCMESCLQKFSPTEKRILLKYYGFAKKERTEQRKQLADDEKISIHLLHTRVARLKKLLRECLKKCLG